MAAETENEQDSPENRKELLEQVAAVLAMHGLQNNPQVQEFMEPLLDGRLTYEEHMQMLEAMMQRLQHG